MAGPTIWIAKRPIHIQRGVYMGNGHKLKTDFWIQKGTHVEVIADDGFYVMIAMNYNGKRVKTGGRKIKLKELFRVFA